MRGEGVGGLRTSREAGGAGAPAAPVVASTPGKLILAGEHAVVYGRPALVAAVDLRLRAHFSSPPAGAGPGVRFDLPRLSLGPRGLDRRIPWPEIAAYARLARERWELYAAAPDPASFRALRGADPLHLVKVALGEAAAALGEREGPPLDLRVDSELPAGAGMGSSAAAAVAVVAGYLSWRGALEGAGHPERGLEPGLDRARIEQVALEVERRQHGSPSGVDVATVLRGGLLWVERREDGSLAPEPIDLPGGPPAGPRSPLLAGLAVYHTGEPPEPTGEVVAAVTARRAAAPTVVEAVLDRIAAGTRALAALLASPAASPAEAIEALRAVEAGLEELGVVPEPVREAVRRVEAEGGAAKVSGAGSLAGPAAGMLLVYHPDPERAGTWPFPSSFTRCPIRLGAAGLRLETMP